MAHKHTAILVNATALPSQDSPGAGLLWGAVGVLAFSLSVPCTRVAALGGLDPTFLSFGRAVVPTVLGAALLYRTRQPVPPASLLFSLLAVAVGCVLGFPYFTAAAARTVPASHSAVVIAMTPLLTACAGMLRTRTGAPALFWFASACGTGAVIWATGGVTGRANLSDGDIALVAAAILVAVGYAEGANAARTLGAWQTICWALVLSLPATIPGTIADLARTDLANVNWSVPTIAAFAYLSLVSMFLAFFAWYRGLGIGPVARISQLQLVQPLISIAWSAALLRERPPASLWAGAIGVLACASFAISARQESSAPTRNSSYASPKHPARSNEVGTGGVT